MVSQLSYSGSINPCLQIVFQYDIPFSYFFLSDLAEVIKGLLFFLLQSLFSKKNLLYFLLLKLELQCSHC
jgi:hypothetical protein